MAIDWNFVGIAAGTAFCGILVALFFGRPLLRAASEIRSLPKMVQGALAALALMATVNGQKLRSGGGGQPDPPAAVTQEEIARGYRLVAETNETGHSFSMPSNAAYVGHLHEHGARSDFGMHMVDFGAWAFPCGTNGGPRSRLWWFMDGRLQDAPRNPGFAASAGLGDTLAVQGESRLWLLADGDGRTVTWERFFACGDTNREANAQISLRSDGGFTVRSNDLVRVYRRVNPDDWDDDGIPNDDDIQPLAYDGDNFGPHQTLPEGANSNAYCWVDLVVPNADALVTFTGDGYSALPDPTFVAKAGATNRVILLIGKTYHVTSRMPIFCIGQSSGEIDVDQVSATELSICWPVEIEAISMRSGASFAMTVVPNCLGGGFTWTNSCCSISSLGGGVFAYSCNDACHCGGCSATGYYGYEGYRLPACGGWCGCSGAYDPSPEQGDDDGPYDAGASATFSKSAVIFEDGYWNTPTNWVERQSTQTELHCVAHGGPNGGHVRFEIAGENKLERVSGHLLPVEQDVLPGKKLDFTIVYKGLLPSACAEDIVVTTTFTENAEGAEPGSSQEKLTSVKVVLTTKYSAPQNTDNHRHTYGIAEEIQYISEPSLLGVTWSFPSDFISRGDGMIMCPWSLQNGSNGSYILTVNAAGEAYETALSVVTPIIAVSNVRVNVYSADVSPVFGEAGHLLLYQDLYATPLYVSFKDVQFREIPDESQSSPHHGYYDDRAKGGNWSHTESDGAGTWYTTLSSGYVMSDKAGRRTSYSTPWIAGSKKWAIPMAWGEGGVVEIPFVPNPTTQEFFLQSNGTFKIRKFGHEAERNIYGLVWKDGDLQW